ncbi:hypothetical protein N7520_006182 [Penicillium odoratum]|uniref:uncharacterized protein n=1 Tax=Penicillium odoratum TaxID=1167516 RepID=UPI0025471CA9|nr:uncharacterized protein N7520_006182 [Penicillium odoratum]KAJ5759026.1 hypothetical protein N7520_006182 [Penicillium odoratum]
MARSTANIMAKGSFLLFLLTMIAIKPTHAFDGFGILPRSELCPSSYDSCGGNVPSDFCCPSSSTCLVLDNDTTALCCPSGSSCEYISPITCDIQEQNATAYPKASVKTTLLSDSLPKCGDECCPFGYTCQNDNLCAMTNSTTTSTTTSTSTSTATSTTSSSITSTTDLSTYGATFTPVSSSVSATSINADSTSSSNSTITSCPSFPSKAVVAGFFPGALCGAIIALLISNCIRHRAEKKHLAEINQDSKTSAHNWSSRSSSGAVLGISSPIASEDASFRTDFLLRNPEDRRSSMSSRSMRSMMNRSSSRVRSLFSAAAPGQDKDVPPLPTTSELPVQPNPVTPPRQREPSTESIKVYSPPAVFMQSRRFLGPEPYPSRIARPSTTFTDLVQAVGFNNEPKENQSFKVHEVRRLT